MLPSGFIQNEPFDPKTWIIPGAKSRGFNRRLKCKVVADVVEALIGAFLSAGGEMAAVLFMDCIGIKLLVEAMTHGSYMLPDVPRCYQ
ncbi:endoribonuclease dicer 2-like, partial [Trifolium medium]|nr:endoribonuclease dicer 2-like [Trifolium medium]